MADTKEYTLILQDGASKDVIASKVDSVIYRMPSNDKMMVVSLTIAQYQRLFDDNLIIDAGDSELHDSLIEDFAVKDVSYKRYMPLGESITQRNPENNSNWGLIRHSNDTNITTFETQTTQQYTYNYDGSGVDLFWLASDMIDVDDPEFKNPDGESRIQQFQFNTLTGLEEVPTIDYNTVGREELRVSHAEACLKIACGNTHGWATGARIFIVPRARIHYSFFHEIVRQFHLQKGNSRPTACGSAYGYRNTPGVIHTVNFRGQGETRNYGGNDITTKNVYKGFIGFGIPLYHTYIDSLAYTQPVDDLCAAGVINVAAAGNYSNKHALPDNIDFNNYYRTYLTSANRVSAIKTYYNRNQPTFGVSTGQGGDTIVAAALASAFGWNTELHGQKETLTDFSDRGDRVDCCAAGENIEFRLTSYNPNGIDKLYSGTSFASPQILGMACLVLQKYPTTTPAQMRKFFREHAISSEKLFDTNRKPIENSNEFGDFTYFDDVIGLQGYSGNITYLDPVLPFNPSTITDTSVVSTEPTISGRLNFTIDEINTKLASI